MAVRTNLEGMFSNEPIKFNRPLDHGENPLVSIIIRDRDTIRRLYAENFALRQTLGAIIDQSLVWHDYWHCRFCDAYHETHTHAPDCLIGQAEKLLKETKDHG